MVQLQTSANSTLGAIESAEVVTEHRPYLSMSEIGHHCERYLWYSFRWCFQREELTPRKARLFARGHREEPNLVKILESVGIRCYGFQDECVAVFGHSKGHCDGKCIGVIEAPKTEHLLEFKTMNDKSFKETVKDGVKISKPAYFGQSQAYMDKMNLTRTLFVATNKNDDSLYIERLYHDKKIAHALFRRAEEIVLSEIPPQKKYEPTWYECRWCDARYICHGNEKIMETCRSCISCDILPDGKWECSSHEIPLATGQQRIGCKIYTMLECLQ